MPTHCLQWRLSNIEFLFLCVDHQYFCTTFFSREVEHTIMLSNVTFNFDKFCDYSNFDTDCLVVEHSLASFSLD